MGCSSSFVSPSSNIIDKQKQQKVSWSEPVILTESQRKLVAGTMRKLRARLGDVGVKVYRTIFAMRPEFKQHFGFRDIEDDDLEYNQRFRDHAIRFMQVVNCAIEAIENKNASDLEKMFHQVGARHLQVKSFQRSNFSLFKEALLHVMSQEIGKDKFKGELFQAWDAVVKYIIQRLQEGYVQAAMEQQDVTEMEQSHNDSSKEHKNGCTAVGPQDHCAAGDVVGGGAEDRGT